MEPTPSSPIIPSDSKLFQRVFPQSNHQDTQIVPYHLLSTNIPATVGHSELNQHFQRLLK